VLETAKETPFLLPDNDEGAIVEKSGAFETAASTPARPCHGCTGAGELDV
jgi:hypothetical protein